MSSFSAADEIAKLAILFRSGDLSANEFQQAKDILLTYHWLNPAGPNFPQVSDVLESEDLKKACEQAEVVRDKETAGTIVGDRLDEVGTKEPETLRPSDSPESLRLLLPCAIGVDAFAEALVGETVIVRVTMGEIQKIYGVHAQLLEQCDYFVTKAARWRLSEGVDVKLPDGVDFFDFESLLYRFYHGRYPSDGGLPRALAALILVDMLLAQELLPEVKVWLARCVNDEQALQEVALVCNSEMLADVVSTLRASVHNEVLLHVVALAVGSDIKRNVYEGHSDRAVAALAALRDLLRQRSLVGLGEDDARTVLSLLRRHIWSSKCIESTGRRAGGSRREHVYEVPELLPDIVNSVAVHITSAETYEIAKQLVAKFKNRPKGEGGWDFNDTYAYNGDVNKLTVSCRYENEVFFDEVMRCLLRVGVQLVNSQVLALESLTGLFQEWSPALTDAFLAELLQVMELSAARHFARFILLNNLAEPLALQAMQVRCLLA
jgi:hypothetical protein